MLYLVRVQRPGFEVQISDILIRQLGLSPKNHRWQDTSSTKTIQVTVTLWDKPKTSLSRQKWILQGIMGLPKKNSKHFWCLFWNVSCFNSLKVRSFFCHFGWFQSLSNSVSHFRSWFLMCITISFKVLPVRPLKAKAVPKTTAHEASKLLWPRSTYNKGTPFLEEYP